MLPVNDALLLFCGESVQRLEWHLGTKEPNPLGAAVERARDITNQTDVHPQHHLMAVSGDARQVLEFFQLLGELPLVRHQRCIVVQ